MARIAGVDLPRNKQARIALTYIFGIGNPRALRILGKANVDGFKKIQDLSLIHISSPFSPVTRGMSC